MKTNYGYDAIYQLLSATQGASTTESYTYDPVGNRTASLGVSSYTTNNSNQLTATSNASYGYDYNGNTTSKTVGSDTTNYAWDFENRLTSVTLPGSGGTVSFKYDPFGRRVYKSSSAATSIFAYDGDNLIEETSSSGAAVARYSQGLNIDEPLAMLRSSTTSFYNADGLGSITSLANASGSLAQTYTFDSFGKQTASSGSLTNPFQYTARELDSETGLYYYRARYYDPGAGRFLGDDPAGFRGGINFYRYSNNSPATLSDPTGLDNSAGRCKELAEKIQNLDRDIAAREKDIEENLKNLPYTCPGDIDSPKLSVEGHLRIIRNLKTDRLLALIEYTIRNCGDYTPLPPIPVPAPSRSPARSPAPGRTATATALGIVGIVLLGVALAL